MVSFGFVSHWHRYCFLMDWAPHLSLRVDFFISMIASIGLPLMWPVWLGVCACCDCVIVALICWAWGRLAGLGFGTGCGNKISACFRASLINFGEVLYLFLNSSREMILFVFGFWICLRVVMPYIYNLLRYFLEFVLCSCVSRL